MKQAETINAVQDKEREREKSGKKSTTSTSTNSKQQITLGDRKTIQFSNKQTKSKKKNMRKTKRQKYS